MFQITTSTNLFSVYICKLYLQASTCHCDHPTPFKHVFKKQFHMWTSSTIKYQLLKEKNPKFDFCMSTIKPKLCELLFHAWTQMCEMKKMIYKRWGITCLLWNFVPNFQMEAFKINATKSLFSLYLTK
jgi:hypothetical protein